ncbi:MAG: hypothetical protein GY906_24375 [bacterium]|nr:hypothetical protein [bacterium]
MREQLTTAAQTLHPMQVSELQQTKRQLEAILNPPPGKAYIREQLQDGGVNVTKQIRGIDQTLRQAPQPYAPDELDAAVKLEGELRADWLQGMPTAAEMRRNPSGAVDKNQEWDRLKKKSVLEWKTLCRRLHASGISPHKHSDGADVSNIERYRPTEASHELNMDNAQIPGAQIHLPPPGTPPAVVITEDDMAKLRAIDPEIAAKIGLASAEQRAQMLDILNGTSTERAPRPKTTKAKRKRRPMTPEQRERAAENLKKAREARAAKAAQVEG